MEPKFIEIFNRHVEKAGKFDDAEARATEALTRLQSYEQDEQSQTLRALTNRALAQGYNRAEVERYLEEDANGDLALLEAELDKDVGGGKRAGSPAPASPDDAMARRLEKAETAHKSLEDRLNLEAENRQIVQDMVDSLKEHAPDFDQTEQGFVGATVQREIDIARATGQKIPNTKEAIRTVVEKLKGVFGKRETAYAEKHKGSGGRVSGADVPDAHTQRELDKFKADPEYADILEAMKNGPDPE